MKIIWSVTPRPMKQGNWHKFQPKDNLAKVGNCGAENLWFQICIRI
jgi:hypothetical protein